MRTSLKKGKNRSIQKILDARNQNGQKFFLVKRRQQDDSQATWEAQQTVSQIGFALIKEYQKSRKNDKVLNFAEKLNDQIRIGQSPYSLTKFHGHFVYGDQPQGVQTIRVYNSIKEGEQTPTKTVILEIKWKARQQIDQTTKKVVLTTLQNTKINSKEVMEYDPQFLMRFYQSKVQLNYVQQNFSSEEERQQQQLRYE